MSTTMGNFVSSAVTFLMSLIPIEEESSLLADDEVADDLGWVRFVNGEYVRGRL